MKHVFLYLTTVLTAMMVLMVNQVVWGATTIQKTTTTTIEKTPAPTAVEVTKAPAAPRNFFVCYNRMTKYMTHNVRIERCNPYGMCRSMIVPVHRKVTAVKNCQINSQGCYGSLSKFGWYSSGSQAQKALQVCRNQPIVVERQKF